MSDAETERPPKSIEFVFEADTSYRVVPANAVWGGVTIRGDLQIDFCVDVATTPERVENNVVGGSLGDEIRRFPPERTITRIRQVGVLMALDHAESMATFVLDKVRKVREALEAQKKLDDGDRSTKH